MAEEFLLFHKFPDEDSAKDFAVDLEKVGIVYKIETVPSFMDSNIMGALADSYFIVKIPSSDFEKANTALREYYKNFIETVDKDYYLFNFSHTELLEIIARPDEWGYFDYQLAQKILATRGTPVNETTMTRLKESRKIELAKPEKDQWYLLVIGYIIIGLGFLYHFRPGGFVLSSYGVVFSFLIGSILAFHKKLLPDGSKVYSYNKETRQHGKIIIALSIVVLCFTVADFIIFNNE
ncbi:MAG: hypothetical protein HOP10_03985 [Chitinophagaceae bacterium]|nr:hypothetical protein [Chitinophagaceae bacterium]